MPTASPTTPPTGAVRLVVGVVIAGFAVNALQYVVAQDASPGHVIPAIACLLLMVTLQITVFSNPRTQLDGVPARAALAVLAVAALAPIAVYGTGWTGMQGFLAADALLVLRPALGWFALGAIALVNGTVQYILSDATLEGLYIAVSTAVTALVVYGLARLRSLVFDLEESRAELATLAVADERARFSRDLDLSLGTSLATIARRIAEARRVVVFDAALAADQIREALEVSRQALYDVRHVASAYREEAVDGEARIRDRLTRPRTVAVTTPDWVPTRGLRRGRWLGVAVFAGYAANATLLVLDADLNVAGSMLAVACTMVSVGVVLWAFVLRGRQPLSSSRGAVVLLVLWLTTSGPVVLFSNAFIVVPGMLAGALLLQLPVRWSVPLFTVVAAGMGAAHRLLGGDVLLSTYGILVTINQGLVVMALSRLQSTVQALHETRSEAVALAVGLERTRFARDMHDLLGFSLTAITLKSELARVLVGRDASAAGHELDEVSDLVRRAVVDARVLSSSVAELSLVREVDAARAMLATLGVELDSKVSADGLSAATSTVLALVLREAITNAVRHSTPRHCRITVARDRDQVSLEIVNDGAPPARAEHAPGSGLSNLAVRLTGLGGDFQAGPTHDGGYRIRAQAPR